MRITLPAGIFKNNNPTLLTGAFAKEEGLELDYRLIRREKILCRDGETFR